MRVRAFVFCVSILTAAGCGGGGGTVTLRGDFPASESAPTSVVAVEAEQEAEVANGGFEIAGLTPGPVTLRLVREGETLGTLAVGNLPGGSVLALRGLRVDPATRRAFPAAVEVDGPGLVRINGLRMGPAGALPDEVDERGVVLATSMGSGIFLLRPDDADLPDLRVLISPAAEALTPDGDPVAVEGLAAGDSVRVEGRTDSGIVVATRLTVPRHLAIAESGAPGGEGVVSAASGGDGSSSGESGGGNGGDSGDDGSDGGDGGGSAEPARRVPVALPRAIRERGGGGGERGKARGRGADKPHGGGKKPKG
ncbi:MAG TPA: hypothetical protein VF746_26090 [Longimicrobium sp.]|jgi:hypothetical protein